MSRVEITVVCGDLDVSVELESPIDYGDEVGRARQMLAECVRRVEQALSNPSPGTPNTGREA